MPDPENETAVPVHVAEQYEAGYGARFHEEAFSLGATRSWQAGWTDANRELEQFEEAFSPAQSSLPFLGIGDGARRRDLPFDLGCSDEWKRSWIEADILMGLEACDPGIRADPRQSRAVEMAKPWKARNGEAVPPFPQLLGRGRWS